MNPITPLLVRRHIALYNFSYLLMSAPETNDVSPEIKIISLVTNKQLETIIQDMFLKLDIKITNLSELDGLVLERDIFLDDELYPSLSHFVPKIKDFLKSSYLTSLHKNSEEKQRFPCINLFRQVLKFANIKMSPFVISQGYEKTTGKKIIKRFFRLEILS